MRAARWLPLLLGAALLQLPHLRAQTSGLAAPISGDCTATATGSVVCNKTAGTSFAASATTDATNASNITRGSLPVAQLPATLSTANVVAQVRSALGNDGSLLAAYLHADGSNPYRDDSGNGNDGVAGTLPPVWTRQGLRYGTANGPGANGPGIGGTYSDNSVTASTWTVPSGVYANAQTYVARLCFLGGDSAGDGSWYGVLAQANAGGGLVLGLSGNSGYNTPYAQLTAYRPSIGTVSAPGGTATNTLTPGCGVYAFVLGTSSTARDAIYVDGQPIALATQTYSGAARGNGTLSFGGGSKGMFLGVDGGVLAINRAITPGEAQALAGILRSYGTGNGLSEAQTSLQAYDEILACADNSICVGDQGGSLYPSVQLSELGSLITPLGTNVLYDSTSAGVRGNTTAHALQRMQQVFPYSSTARRVTYFLHDCTNDWVEYDSGNGKGASNAAYQVCAQRALQLARDLHKLGPNVRTVVMPEWQNTTNGATQVVAVNAYLRANCAASGADVCLADSDPVPYAANAAANTTYFRPDGTHPNTTGQHYKATMEAIGYNLAWNSATALSPTTIGSGPSNSPASYTMLVQDRFLRIYNGGAPGPTVTLPSCLSLSGDYTLLLDAAVQAYVKTAAASQTVNGADYSSNGYLLPAGVRQIFTVVAQGNGGGCTWRTTFPQYALESVTSPASGSVYGNYSATTNRYVLTGNTSMDEAGPTSEIIQCHVVQMGSTPYTFSYVNSPGDFVGAVNITSPVANKTYSQCFKGLPSIGKWVAISGMNSN